MNWCLKFRKTFEKQLSLSDNLRFGLVRQRTIYQVLMMLVVIITMQSSRVSAEGDELYIVNLPAQSVADSLTDLSIQIDKQLLFPYKLAKGIKANPVVGQYTLNQLLIVMLEGTGFSGGLTKRGVLMISLTKSEVTGDKTEGISDMNTKKKLLASVVSFFVGSSGSGAFAQEVADAKEGSGWMLEEIIVTAQKREQNLIDVPISIVALGAAEIGARGIGNFEDLGMAVPGLSVQDNGGSNRRVFMRGLGNSAGASSSLIGLYIDDMSVSGNPSFTLDVRPYDMERVEVLRGPQGTLYGDGSVGGTIRFITKKPQLESFSARADFASYFTKGGEPGQKIQTAINVPLINDELGLRIVGTFEDAGGWIDQPAQSIEDYNGQEVANIRVNSLWHATDALDVSAMAIVHRNDSSLNIGEDENGNHTQAFDVSDPPSFDDEYELYTLTMTYDFDSFEVLSSTGYLDSFTETNGFGYDFSGLDVLLDNGLINTTIFSEEFRISSTNEDALRWSIGAFYKDRQIDQTGDFYFGAPGPLSSAFAFTSVDNQNSQSWAVFGDASFSLSTRLEVGAGLRYFEDDRDFSDGVAKQTGSFDSTSPRIYVNFDLTDDVKTYASVAKGFRSGGFNQLGQPTFDSETVWSYELGTKMSLLDGRLGAELALFYSDYEDFQVSGILPPPAPINSITSNGGNAEIKGVDLSLAWQATDGLVLGFNGSYIDTEVVQLNVTSSSHEVGDRLDYAPEYSMALSATQNFEWGGKPGLARLDYNVQGRMLFTDRASGLFGSSDVINMLNFNVEWELSEDISFGVFGKNILDERGFIDPLDALNLASRPRPRTLGIQVGLDF